MMSDRAILILTGVAVVSGATTLRPAESQQSLAVLGNANPTREECTEENRYWDSDEEICAFCVKCPVGLGSTASQCGSGVGEIGECKPCIDGKTFQDQFSTQGQCLMCRRCDENAVVLFSCTAEQDTDCRCKNGYGSHPGQPNLCSRCDFLNDYEKPPECQVTTPAPVEQTTAPVLETPPPVVKTSPPPILTTQDTGYSTPTTNAANQTTAMSTNITSTSSQVTGAGSISALAVVLPICILLVVCLFGYIIVRLRCQRKIWCMSKDPESGTTDHVATPEEREPFRTADTDASDAINERDNEPSVEIVGKNFVTFTTSGQEQDGNGQLANSVAPVVRDNASSVANSHPSSVAAKPLVLTLSENAQLIDSPKDEADSQQGLPFSTPADAEESTDDLPTHDHGSVLTRIIVPISEEETQNESSTDNPSSPPVVQGNIPFFRSTSEPASIKKSWAKANTSEAPVLPIEVREKCNDMKKNSEEEFKNLLSKACALAKSIHWTDLDPVFRKTIQNMLTPISPNSGMPDFKILGEVLGLKSQIELKACSNVEDVFVALAAHRYRELFMEEVLLALKKLPRLDVVREICKEIIEKKPSCRCNASG